MHNLIEQVLVEQNPHWAGERYDHAFERLHNHLALEDLTLTEIQVITGIRRCGKSTLLKTMINHLIETHESKSILYVNFDDPNYTPSVQDSGQLYTIITTAEKITGVSIEFVLFDEIQNVIAWEKVIKSVYDSNRFKKIIITGSNSDLLKSDYTSLLSGRYVETSIYPLCFKEILANHGINTLHTLIQHKVKVLRLLDEYMLYGGFPRIHQIQNPAQKKRILQNYYDTILLKDCISNHNIRDTHLFFSLTHYLLSHISSLYSYNSLSRTLGSNENTIKQFISVLHNAYFIFEVKQFSYSLRAQIKAKKKVYCIDNGLFTAVSYKFSNNYGKLLENLVFSELKKNELGEINIHNDEKECDFIIKTPEGLTAIQVCYQLSESNQAREINGLKAAMKKLAINKGIIITYNQTQTVDDNLAITSFWQFFTDFKPEPTLK